MRFTEPYSQKERLLAGFKCVESLQGSVANESVDEGIVRSVYTLRGSTLESGTCQVFR